MAMQAIWKGAISFGMVTIPIKVFSATEEKDISFRQVHVADGGRIKYKRICSIDGEEVPYSDIGKGYDMPDGRVVVLDSDDFADLALSSKKVIDVLVVVAADQVDPLSRGPRRERGRAPRSATWWPRCAPRSRRRRPGGPVAGPRARRRRRRPPRRPPRRRRPRRRRPLPRRRRRRKPRRTNQHERAH